MRDAWTNERACRPLVSFGLVISGPCTCLRARVSNEFVNFRRKVTRDRRDIPRTFAARRRTFNTRQTRDGNTERGPPGDLVASFAVTDLRSALYSPGGANPSPGNLYRRRPSGNIVSTSKRHASYCHGPRSVQNDLSRSAASLDHRHRHNQWVREWRLVSPSAHSRSNR